MATRLVYNGVTFCNVHTLEFDQRPVRDQSDTDTLYILMTIRIEAICCASAFLSNNPNVGVLVPGGSASATAGDIEVALRRRILEQRKSLLYTMENRTIVSSDHAHDVNNGPKPLDLKVTNVAPGSIRIEFTIETALVECDNYSGTITAAQSPILNNRWSCVDDLDEQARTTRHWRGRLRISTAELNPQSFRGVVVPPLNPGWKRKRMNFVSELNSLELGYEITDEEMLGESPPSPAYKMAGTHMESVSVGADNAIGELNLRLDGAKSSDKRQMMQRAVQIVVTKLRLKREQTRFALLQLILIDHFGDNVNAVEARARVRHTIRAKSKIDGLGPVVTDKIARPLDLPDYDPLIAPIVKPYGTASPASLFACFLQSPCNNQHAMPQATEKIDKQGSDPSYGGDRETEITYSSGSLGSDFEETGLSDAHLENAYQFCQIESVIVKKHNRLALPIAADSTNRTPAKTSALIELCGPTAKRIVRMRAERIGEWPTIFADKDFTDRNGIECWILDFRPEFRAPKLQGDGITMLYALDVEYTFGMSRAPAAGEPMPTASLPWDNTTSAQNYLPSSSFTDPSSDKGLR